MLSKIVLKILELVLLALASFAFVYRTQFFAGDFEKMALLFVFTWPIWLVVFAFLCLGSFLFKRFLHNKKR